jgi:hypothetical protein
MSSSSKKRSAESHERDVTPPPLKRKTQSAITSTSRVHEYAERIKA